MERNNKNKAVLHVKWVLQERTLFQEVILNFPGVLNAVSSTKLNVALVWSHCCGKALIEQSRLKTSRLSPKHHMISLFTCHLSSLCQVLDQKRSVWHCDTATGRNSPAYWRREKNSFLVLTHIPNMWSRCSWDERDLSLCVLNGGYFGRSDQACFIMSRHYSPLEMEGYGRGKNKKNEPRYNDEVIWFARAVLLHHIALISWVNRCLYLLMREKKVSDRL